ncbi:MAG: phospho-sugar mutase, partial [Bacteroidota bacterium]
MDEIILKNAAIWLNEAYDKETRIAVRKLIDDKSTELTDSFYRNLEFGTGGLRGIMGVGSNRMNKYTVGMATQGLANYLNQSFPDKKEISVAIAYDSRNNSRNFAEIAADVLSGNNIMVYLFDNLRPTPELSFAIRYLECESGIVITASHNPKEYNGYKVYWNDGGQLVSPHDVNVINEVQKIASVEDVKFDGNPKLIQMIGNDIDTVYLEKLKSLSISPEIIKQHKDLKIVYTPIHGTGITLVPKALKLFGFENVIIVEDQAVPDGNFPTTPSPNPEERAAMALALQKAIETQAAIALATDPDADRVGVAVKNIEGEYVLLNGNQAASILIYYILHQMQHNGQLQAGDYIVKTIVTTELLKEIAESFGLQCFDVLTGF